MKHETLFHRTQYMASILLGHLALLIPGLAPADELQEAVPGPGKNQYYCTQGQGKKIKEGLKISPVKLDLTGKNLRLVALGSYIVNAQAGCNDCHTNPAYKTGGNPFLGQPEKINAEVFLAGGRAFSPTLIAANITPCDNGKPHGLSYEQFETVMRTGMSEGRTLQVMPWPIYGNMKQCDLRAVYEYLRSIPAYSANGCGPALP